MTFWFPDPLRELLRQLPHGSVLPSPPVKPQPGYPNEPLHDGNYTSPGQYLLAH